ncbi:hypothetical protein OVY48_21165 [Sphingobium sp. SA2]|jgi:hypothetical protein|uniref:hypothetical protein n=1 Tax=Sphingobium sp. SA2 TaxID=1524832 RepID=UPI0028C3660D|nr:hypothetical protein [Sphingobium sp. SA2]MDT7535910.1 hypothetical protein [Sphingobium sp. SA2]
MLHADDRGLQALRARAYTLAETGHFENIRAVEQALIAEGWPNAAQALDSEYARKAVGERCRMAKAH